ncbi:hypothetical protein F5Y13DRAFT_204783 [Hypoxylon sp. FL1857]|nr:hypothetical protein F5Y13DRAFT_204783 [Hypoxylon sp. FL1857]
MDVNVSPDPSISNGTCYYADSKESKKDYIPCGNGATGDNYACCFAGDYCVAGHVCWAGDNPLDEYYLAGCTDPDYSDTVCPDKGYFDDQQWVALKLCDYKNNVWVGCKETDDVPNWESMAPCTCSKENELLTMTPSPALIGKLPKSLGGSISSVGNPVQTLSVPTSPPPVTSTLTTIKTTTSISASSSTRTGTATSTSASDSSSSSPTDTPISSSDGSPVIPSSSQPNTSTGTSSDSNLSPSAQAGIGVGAGVGAVMLGALLFLAFFLRKRKNGKRDGSTTQPDFLGSPNSQNFHAALLPGNGGDPGSNLKRTTFMSELAAEEPKRTSTLNTRSPSPALTSPTGFLPQTHRLYTAYNPHLHGNYAMGLKSESPRPRESQVDAEAPASPVSPVSTVGPTIVVSEPVNTSEKAKENPKEEEKETKEEPEKAQETVQPPATPAIPTTPKTPATPPPEGIHELAG